MRVFNVLTPTMHEKQCYSLLDMIEEYYLDKKAKALHRKRLASVLSEIKAHYACNHTEDHEWFLNDLKTQEPEITCGDILLVYTYRTRGACRGLSYHISMDMLLAHAVFDSGRPTLPAYFV